jgi:hypothetical protein
MLHDDTDSGTTTAVGFGEDPTEIDPAIARRRSHDGESHACIDPTNIVILGMKHDSEIPQVLDDAPLPARSIGESERYDGGSRRDGDLLLTIQDVGDGRRSHGAAGLKVPKRFPCSCIQRDEVTLGVAREY